MGQVEDSIIRGGLRLTSKKKIQYRVDAKKLDIVCIDCSDFLHHKCVECEDCPVHRLKGRVRFQNEYKFDKPNTEKIK